jgi:ornithine cyclodeaminase/alanine dehydrogenase-like protein (mu-crystallin family)
MTVAMIPFTEGEVGLDWLALTRAMVAGHQMPKAQIKDVLMYRGADTLLNRTAWIDGMGIAVKAGAIYPGNLAKGKPTVNGAVNLFSDEDGALEAILDFHLVTKWKTAGDSLLAATRLARKDSRNILIVGAGTVGKSLLQAYSAAFPDARFTIWNRSAKGAAAFAAAHPGVTVAPDLEAAVRAADIITCATMSSTPVILGDWLQPGQHIDLIGAYTPAMRESDDTAVTRSRVFVDNIGTTVDHIGDLMGPIASGAITAAHVLGDFYAMDTLKRHSDAEITLFKNGGGAHLDLMTSRYILDVWRAR